MTTPTLLLAPPRPLPMAATQMSYQPGPAAIASAAATFTTATIGLPVAGATGTDVLVVPEDCRPLQRSQFDLGICAGVALAVVAAGIWRWWRAG